MFTEERQQAIVDLLKERSSVTIAELEKRFAVSNETIRRDLLALEGQKRLIRVHGGAMSIHNGFYQKSFTERHTEHLEEKKELSNHAIEFIKEGDILAVDSGSTAVIFCELLVKRFHSLTVVTNSLMLFHILSQNQGFRLILCSGEYDRENQAFFGTLTVESIRHLHIAKTFLFPSAISLRHGLTDFSEEFIPVQQAFGAASDKCFVMVDHSKFEVGGLYNVLALHSDMTVITDSRLSDDIYQRYIDADIDIIRGE